MKPDFKKAGKLAMAASGGTLIAALLLGCAAERVVVRQSGERPQTLDEGGKSPTKAVETAFQVRSYRDAENPSLRHDAHAIYRTTRVPITANEELATVPRADYPAPSFAPLSGSDELAAELATQKAITGNLRELQTSIAETERQVQAQYATLVQESAEVLKVRDQLEAERARLHMTPAPNSGAATTGTAPGNSTEVKW